MGEIFVHDWDEKGVLVREQQKMKIGKMMHQKDNKKRWWSKENDVHLDNVEVIVEGE